MFIINKGCSLIGTTVLIVYWTKIHLRKTTQIVRVGYQCLDRGDLALSVLRCPLMFCGPNGGFDRLIKCR